jgi:hypothetical protein
MAKASLLLSCDLLCVETIELPSSQADELILPISCSSGPQLMKMTGHNGRRACRCCNIWGVLKDDEARATSYCPLRPPDDLPNDYRDAERTFRYTYDSQPALRTYDRFLAEATRVHEEDVAARRSRPGGMTSLESMGSRDSCVFSLSLPICTATRSISEADAQESNLSL